MAYAPIFCNDGAISPLEQGAITYRAPAPTNGVTFFAAASEIAEIGKPSGDSFAIANLSGTGLMTTSNAWANNLPGQLLAGDGQRPVPARRRRYSVGPAPVQPVTARKKAEASA